MKTELVQRMNEAEKIYSCIFDQNTPAGLVDIYEKATEYIFQNYTNSEIDAYKCIVKNIKDLESFELASRYLKTNRLLTVQFQLMIRLGEAYPENFDFFINRSNKGLWSYYIFFLRIITSIFKIIKGSLLVLLFKHE